MFRPSQASGYLAFVLNACVERVRRGATDNIGKTADIWRSRLAAGRYSRRDASAATSARRETPSLAKTWATCVCTVRGET
jgi:hypothetical protein